MVNLVHSSSSFYRPFLNSKIYLNSLSTKNFKPELALNILTHNSSLDLERFAERTFTPSEVPKMAAFPAFLANALIYFVGTFVVAKLREELEPGADSWRRQKIMNVLTGDTKKKYIEQKYFFNHPESIHKSVEDLPVEPPGTRIANRPAHLKAEEDLKHFVMYLMDAIAEYPKLLARDKIRTVLCERNFTEELLQELENLYKEVRCREVLALSAYIADHLGLTHKRNQYLDKMKIYFYRSPSVDLQKIRDTNPGQLLQSGYLVTPVAFGYLLENCTLELSESKCVHNLTKKMMINIFFNKFDACESPLTLYASLKMLKEIRKKGPLLNTIVSIDSLLNWQLENIFLPAIVKPLYENLIFLQKENKLHLLPTAQKILSNSPFYKKIQQCLGHQEDIRHVSERSEAEKELERTTLRKELDHTIKQPTTANYVREEGRGFRVLTNYKHYDEQTNCSRYKEVFDKDLKKTLEEIDLHSFNQILAEMSQINLDQINFSDAYHTYAYWYNLSKIQLNLTCARFEVEKMLEDPKMQDLLLNLNPKKSLDANHVQPSESNYLNFFDLNKPDPSLRRIFYLDGESNTLAQSRDFTNTLSSCLGDINIYTLRNPAEKFNSTKGTQSIIQQVKYEIYSYLKENPNNKFCLMCSRQTIEEVESLLENLPDKIAKRIEIQALFPTRFLENRWSKQVTYYIEKNELFPKLLLTKIPPDAKIVYLNANEIGRLLRKPLSQFLTTEQI